MTKRKHIRMTQSEDEYWTEPQSNSNQQAQCDEHAESSINSKSSTNINQEGDEVIIEDENGQRKRGKTKLVDLWNLPRGHRVVVNCNTQGQPIGNEGGLLGQFLGTIARNGGICTLSHKDWRYVKKDAEKDIIAQVKGKFLYQARCEKWILKSTGRKWKDYKCDLKAAYFDEKASLKELYNLAPKDVIKDQWVYLVDFWKSNEGKAWSIRNRKNRTMLETTHTAGTKSFARVGEEMVIMVQCLATGQPIECGELIEPSIGRGRSQEEGKIRETQSRGQKRRDKAARPDILLPIDDRFKPAGTRRRIL